MPERIGLEALFLDQDFRRGIQNYTKKVQEAEGTTDKAATGITKDTQKIGKGWGDAGKKVGLAMAGIGAVMGAVVTKITLTAARTEELGVVLTTVGRNVGKTEKQMAAYEDGVKKMGITTQASRQALIQMAQAQIGLEHSTDLARLAQDAAVIAQLDSSQAFEQLITVIQRGSLVMARNLGLVVDFQGAYKRYADEAGRSIQTLTQQEKIQIRVGEVMRNSAQIAGTYEAAMGTAGKQMRSMRRYTEELANEFGSALLPAFSKGIQGTTGMLKALLALPKPIKDTVAQVGALSAATLTIAGAAALAIPKIISMIGALRGLAAAAGLSLGPLGLVLGAITAVGAGVLYLKNLERAHREEAAAILDSAEAYNEYVSAMRHAELENYMLSESLYDVAKAADNAGESIDALEFQEAREETKKLGDDVIEIARLWSAYGEQQDEATTKGQFFRDMLGDVLPEMSDLSLKIAQNKEEMIQFALSEGIAGKEAVFFAEAIGEAAKAEENLRFFITAANEGIDDHIEAMQEVGQALDLADKAATPYIKDVTALAQETGLAIKEVYRLKIGLGYTDEEIKKIGDDLHLTGGEMADLAEETGLTRERIEELNTKFGMGEEAISDYANALEEAAEILGLTVEEMDALAEAADLSADEMGDLAGSFEDLEDAVEDAKSDLKDFFGALSDGVEDVRDLDDEIADVTTTSKEKIADLNRSASEELAGLKEKYLDSLPDRTSVSERTDMAADAWDEYALRIGAIMDGVMTDQEAGWLATVTAAANAAGVFQQKGEGLNDYLSRVLTAFYAGDIPDLINTEAAAWKTLTAENKASYDQDVANLNAKYAQQRQAAAAAAAEEKALLEEQRAERTLQATLQIAEASGALAQFATSAFPGVMGEMLSDADTFFEYYKNGWLGNTEAVEGFLTGEGTKFLAFISETEGAHQAAQQATLDFYTASAEGAVNYQTALDLTKTGLAELVEQKAALTEVRGEATPEDLLAIDQAISDIDAKIAGLQATLDAGEGGIIGEYFGEDIEGIMEPVNTAIGDIETKLEEMGVTGGGVFQEMLDNAIAAFDGIRDVAIGNSAIPDIVKAMEGMKGTFAAVSGSMAGVWNATTSGMISSWEKFVGKAKEGIQDIKAELQRIPRTIHVTVVITTQYNPTVPTAQAIDVIHDKLDNLPKTIPINIDVGGAGIAASSDNLASMLFNEPVTVADAERIGGRIGSAFIGAVHGKVRRPEKWTDRLLGIGMELAGIGDFFAGLYKEQTLDPLKDDLDDVIKESEELDRLLEDQAFLRMLTQEEYNTLLARQAELQKERNALEDEYAEKQKDILELEKAQADLAFLEQQSKLLDLIQEWDLDPAEILGGLELGLDASITDLIAAMSKAIQEIVKQAEKDLGIQSPSKVFMKLAQQAMMGFTMELGSSAPQVADAMGRAMEQVIGGAERAIIQGPGFQQPIMPGPVTNTNNLQTVEINFGDTNLADSMDEAAFHAKVLNTVRDAIQQGE